MKRVALLVVVVAVSACGPSKSGNSISCDVPTQNICYEDDNPTSDQLQNLPVKCSSVSGTYATPAACPQTGYVGKCTFAAPDGTETDRYYTGTDAAYQQDFCVNVALGTWSTAF
jgi:hypothetical protein